MKLHNHTHHIIKYSIIAINPAQLAIQRSNLGEKTLHHYFYLLLNNDCKVKRQTQQCYVYQRAYFHHQQNPFLASVY